MDSIPLWELIRLLSIIIVFANTNTASSDTILKPHIHLIALKLYTEDSPHGEHIRQVYNIIDVTTANIILLKTKCFGL